MTNTKKWIDDIKRVEPPDLWDRIEQRTATGSVGSPSPSRRPLLAVTILAVSVLVLGSVFYSLGRIGEPSVHQPSAGEIVRYELDDKPGLLVVGEGAAWVKAEPHVGSSYLARIDAATGAVTEIDVSRIANPGWLVPAVGGRSVWLSCRPPACAGASAVQLDAVTGEAIRSVPIPAPWGELVGVTEGVWVTTESSVVFINSAGEKERRLDLGERTLLGTDGTYLWVNTDEGIAGFDPESGAKLASVRFPGACTIDVAQGMVWVASCKTATQASYPGEPDELLGIDAANGDVLFRRRIDGDGQMRYANGVLWLAQNDPTGVAQRLRILRFDPLTGARLDDPISILRSEPLRDVPPYRPARVQFAVGEGSLWLTDYSAGEVIRVGLPHGGLERTGGD